MTPTPRPAQRRRSRAGPVAATKERSASAGLGDPIPLGRTGRTQPPLGLGLWALGRWRPEDEARTKATLGHALERGMRWFDTAEVYGGGRSERILGDVLRRAGPAAQETFVVTKLSWEHLRPAQVRPALLGSLQRMGRTSIDLYLVHAPDTRVPIAGTMQALEALWKEGRIEAIGVSNFSVDELKAARAALRETDLVANQVLYNLFEPAEGDAVVEYCRQEGIVLQAYTPLCRGLLAGRYLDEAPSGPVHKGPLSRERFPEFQSRARKLAALAREAKLPMAALALHWLRRRGAAPVFGASRPEQVDRVLEAWQSRPTERLLDRAEALARGTDA